MKIVVDKNKIFNNLKYIAFSIILVNMMVINTLKVKVSKDMLLDSKLFNLIIFKKKIVNVILLLQKLLKV